MNNQTNPLAISFNPFDHQDRFTEVEEAILNVCFERVENDKDIFEALVENGFGGDKE